MSRWRIVVKIEDRETSICRRATDAVDDLELLRDLAMVIADALVRDFMDAERAE